MTQTSRFWDGTAVGDATVAPYDAVTEFSRVMQSISGAGGVATNQAAVFRGELNELAVTGVATPVSIASGRAINAGTWFENDAATTVAIPTPAASTRIDRIVLRKDWSAAVQTVRVTRIAGVEGGGAPALVQVWGTMWDEPLAQASITTGGVITVTDQRQFIGDGPLINLHTFAVGDLLYADTTTTLARLADVVAGSVLVSGGVSVAPAWNANLLVTSANVRAAQALRAEGTSAPTTGGTAPELWVNSGEGYLSTYNRGGSAYANQGYDAAQHRWLISGVEKARILTSSLLVGATVANTFMTQGVTVNQGANTDEIAAFKSSTVAHGITAITETDTYIKFKKQGSAGGARMEAFSGGSIGLLLGGNHVADDTTKSNASFGAIYMSGAVKSGTSTAAQPATANIMTIATGGTVRFIFQADGTSYEDVGTTWTNYDDHDDLALLTDLSIAASRGDDAIHRRFANFLRYSPDMLQAMDLIHFNENGHHFANRSKIQMALIGASRQLGDRASALEQRIIELETQLLALQGAS